MDGKREEAGLRLLTSGLKRKRGPIPLRGLSLPGLVAGFRLPMLNKMRSEAPSSANGPKWRRISVAVIFMVSPKLNADYCRWRSGNLSASGGITMSTVRTCLVRWECNIPDQKEKF